MIVSRVGSYLDIIVTVSPVAIFIFWLMSEIPVRHINASSWSEEFFHIVKDLDPLFTSAQVMIRCEKHDSIVFSSFENIKRKHITHFEAISSMELSSFFDHPDRVIYAEVFEFAIYNSSCITREKSPISTSDIEDACIALLTDI